MAYENNLLMKTFEAAEDLSADQYSIVVLDSNGKVQRPNAATDKPIGVLQNAPESGEAAAVMLAGISKVTLGATLAVNATVALEYVSATDAGKAKASATGQYPVGRLLEGGVEDELGTLKINISELPQAA